VKERDFQSELKQMELFNKASTKDKRRDLRKRRTEAEEALWQQLRDRNLSGHKFFRQYGIGEYIADFYCPQCNLVIELDGSRHGTGEGKAYDKSREDYMNSLGIRTVRFSNIDVLQNIEKVLSRIEKELTQ
jgi:very-short-patch-repair endonuclease